MIRCKLHTALLALGLVSASLTAVHAGEVRIINLDGPGQGLNDPTPASPVGGNPGTTRGQQAQVVFQFAADLWGAVLQSDVPVLNTVTFTPLTCTATSGVLGSSGTNYIFAFNAPAPAGAKAGVWYHSALADALSGTDVGLANELPADTPDIISRFNSSLGNTGCLEGSGWYFGLDGKTPPGQINFLNVVVHEMAHGLGFSGFNTLSTGAQLQNRADIYSTFVMDNQTGKAWTDMTNAQRKTAALNDGHLVFTGLGVKAEAPLALAPLLMLNVTAPAVVAGSYDYNAASFGPAPSPANFTGSVARPSNPLACDAVDASVTGKIALIDRGTCAFAIKVKNAQDAGAKAVIIANNQAGAIAPGGGDATITIPTIGVTQATGNLFVTHLAGLAVALGPDAQNRLAGGDAQGNVQLYAPTTLAQGSSFSHYDTRLTPNAIMEYAISEDLMGHIDLDLTPALLRDEGWKINGSTQTLLSCNSGIPTWMPGGVIVGANVISNLKAQASAAANLAGYRSAALAYAAQLAASGMINAAQASSLNACLVDAELKKQFIAWGSGVEEPDLPPAIALQNGGQLSGQSGAAGSSTIYKLEVPTGALALTLRTLGGTGNVSLYVKRGAPASATSYDYKSVNPGNAESVAISRPVAATYYLTVVGETAYGGVTVLGNYTVPK